MNPVQEPQFKPLLLLQKEVELKLLERITKSVNPLETTQAISDYSEFCSSFSYSRSTIDALLDPTPSGFVPGMPVPVKDGQPVQADGRAVPEGANDCSKGTEVDIRAEILNELRMIDDQLNSLGRLAASAIEVEAEVSGMIGHAHEQVRHLVSKLSRPKRKINKDCDTTATGGLATIDRG